LQNPSSPFLGSRLNFSKQTCFGFFFSCLRVRELLLPPRRFESDYSLSVLRVLGPPSSYSCFPQKQPPINQNFFFTPGPDPDNTTKQTKNRFLGLFFPFRFLIPSCDRCFLSRPLRLLSFKSTFFFPLHSPNPQPLVVLQPFPMEITAPPPSISSEMLSHSLFVFQPIIADATFSRGFGFLTRLP